eukprot:TRINITY_DN8934_c0_g1_i1.p1 TRINITY_DN8934_c0_g1~~TRINITY_DN8934_c0_g1_i1.p1  ORF type:complete len:309 (-),score=98.91 TRINITY_DN8934_c0_g1_i1:143-1069(-)
MAPIFDQSLTLNNGRKLPQLGLGTWRSEKGKVKTAVQHALLAGYRHIDAAAIYANQEEVGEGITAAIAESNGDLKREDIFVTSKIWNDNHKKEDALAAGRLVTKELGLEYVDLLLIHWPVSFEHGKDSKSPIDVPFKETYQALEQLVDEGVAKSIGVSNFTIEEVKEVLAFARIKPVANQIEGHPFLDQTAMQKFLTENDMVLTAYSPLGNFNPGKDGNVTPLDDPVYKAIADKHSKSVAQVLIRWSIDSGKVVIPKSTTPSRIEENANVWDFTLSKDEVDQITTHGATKNLRLCNPPFRNGGTSPVF